MTTTVNATEAAFDRLALNLDGRLARPTDADWNTACLAWNLAVQQRPLAVAFPENEHDIVEVVATARELSARVAGQATGHNASPLGDLSDTILIKTAMMRSVQIDPEARTARVQAGAWWMDVTNAAAVHGLAALAGSSPDVDVAGYTLGGGMSWLARSHGLAANTIVALEVVTADGRHRRVDAVNDPDLFWAMRGGGGSFGIVTTIELRLFPITEVYAGALFFPVERADEVLHAWHAWLPSTPESVTSVGRIMKFPPLPDFPPFLSGKSFVLVEAVCQLDPAEADALLAPLRALEPAMDTFHPTPMTELSQLHMDPPTPVPGCGDGMLLGPLDAHGLAAFTRISEQTGPALLSMELRQLGGAVRRGASDGGAVNAFDADFALFAVGIAPTPEIRELVHQAVSATLQAMAPWATGRRYLNFSETPQSGATLFGIDTHERLVLVKTAYDPTDLVRSNHPIAPAKQY